MPVYVYPQGPSAAISKLKRIDENASANEPVQLDSEQQAAIIGETIPLVFGKRADDVGGMWVDPRLIQIGLKDDQFSLLYVLTQGRLVNLPDEDVRYGSTPVNDINPHSLCLAYQQIPDCVDIEYTPGGNLGWETTVLSSGPSLDANQSEDKIAAWTSTTSKCIGFSMSLRGTVTVSGSGSYLQEEFTTLSTGEFASQSVSLCPDMSVPASYGQATNTPPNYPQSPYLAKSLNGAMGDLNALSNGRIPAADRYNARVCFNSTIAWAAFSFRYWQYRVIDVATEQIVRTGEAKGGGNDQTFTVTEDNLPASRYRVEFYGTYANRSSGPAVRSVAWASKVSSYCQYYVLGGRPEVIKEVQDSIRHQNNIFAAYNNNTVENVSGNESVSVAVPSVLERVYDELEVPDGGGSGTAPDGGYRNLTLLGFKGPVDTLRPPLGPEYFLQLHCFCREGIYVKQQLQGMQLGPSNVYSDLVLYLLEQGGLLKTEQIDYQALLYAARFCEQYKLHFNGVINTTSSGAEYLTRTAPYFLLSPRQTDGKYGLIPVVPIDAQYKIDLGPVQPVMVLTTDDMVQDSYSRQYINVHDRRPVVATMFFRDQSPDGPGQPRTIEVRYPGTANDGPYESHDMTEFCVSANHAAYAARYILAKKRHVTHTVECVIGRRGRALRPGDIVQIDLDLDTTDGDGLTDSTLYEIESISESVGGQVALTLLHFPVDSNGTSLIAKDIAEGAVEIQ